MAPPRRQPQLMTETDGPDDDLNGGRPDRTGGIAEGLVNTDRGQPAQRQDQGGEDQFFVIETDDNGRPLNGGAEDNAGQQQDGNLDDDPAGGQGADDGHQDDRLQDDGQGGTRAERETRAARRQRQKMGRERTLQRNAELEAQVAELQTKIGGIEPRLSEFDQDRARRAIADIDRQINESASIVAAARKRMAEGITNGDPEAVMAALDERDQAMMKGQQALARKNIFVHGNAAGIPRSQAQPGQGQQQPQVDPNAQRQQQPAPLPTRVQNYIRSFQESHDWYNPDDPADTDSQIVKAIDNAVMADGYDPNSPDYWNELQDRIRERLPHKFRRANAGQGQGAPRQQQQPQVPQARRGPQVGGPAADRGNGNNGRRQGVQLTPQRKQALVDLGVLAADGTPVDSRKLNNYLRQYAEYDRVNGAAR